MPRFGTTAPVQVDPCGTAESVTKVIAECSPKVLLAPRIATYFLSVINVVCENYSATPAA